MVCFFDWTQPSLADYNCDCDENMLFTDHPWVDVRAEMFGADPTGVIDSTVAIQAAIDHAISIGNGNQRGTIVYLGTGIYKISDTITITNDIYQYGAVQLLGHSPRTTIFAYEGPNDRAAIYSDRQANSGFGNFTVQRSGALGTSVGVAIGGSAGSGTINLGNDYLPIHISGFATGLYIGAYGAGGPSLGVAASELFFQRVRVSGCTKGIVLDSANTLNIVFAFLDTNSNNYGLWSNTSKVHVLAGAGAQNDIADFLFQVGGDNSIRNWRTETPNRLLITSTASILLENVNATLSSNADDILVEVHSSSLVKLDTCQIIGKIGVDGSGAIITLIDTVVRGPQFAHAISAGSLVNTKVTAIGSYMYNGAGVEQAIPSFIEELRGQADDSLVGIKSPVAGGLWTNGKVLATNATVGFLGVPSSAGVPTGVPVSIPAGQIPCQIDTTNGRAYFYYGGAWHFATLT